MRIVDLSHSLFNGASSYPSDPKIVIKKEKDILNNKSLLHNINFGTHSGTHLDVPAHTIHNGKTLSDFPLDAFMGTAVLLDDTNYNRFNKLNEKIDTIIYNTGWYKDYNDPIIYFGNDRPGIPGELIQFIIDNDVKIFGCDLPSVDVSGSKEKPIHKALLGNDIIIYESLTNLHQLPLLMPFQFFGLPLPFRDLDGSPVRAVAILE